MVCSGLVFCAATTIALHAQALTTTSRLSGVLAAAPAECSPVAYLFRHAEDINNIVKKQPFQVTLAVSGQAHAQLYIEMVNKFQQQNSYCPIRTVYAVNPRLANGDNGTSNPYWTAEPLAQATQTTLDSQLSNSNAVITVQDKRLTQKLDNGEAEALLGDIKSKLNNQQSVALFWTSEGMCTVAEKFGVNLPSNYCDEVDPMNPPRNSVFQFSYSLPEGKFTSVTEYAQCFNFNADPSQNKFTDGAYYCQYSYNLEDWAGVSGFSSKLDKISGRICDKNNPQPPCVK